MFKALRVQPAAQLDPACISCTPPEHDPEVIGFSDHWKLVLHPSQCGLGTVLLTARRHVPRMADLSPEEALDFQAVIAVLEPALERAFGAPLVNMSYQRNWAYRQHRPDPPFKDGQPNPHVHWHVMPRYPAAISFEGVIFDDPAYGEPFEWRTKQVATSVRQAILRRLQAQMAVTFIG